MPSAELPEFRNWSIAAVRLLQGVVYSDDTRVWDIVLSCKPELERYLARLGLLLVVDEPEGLAYLQQLEEDECPEGYDALPKLFRKTRLGYNATLLCVLLRDELRRFEEEDVHNERCVVDVAVLFDQWKTFFPSQHDEVRQRRELSTALRKLEELGFVRKFSDEPETWEIRRILKARLPIAVLEGLKAQLLAAAERRGDGQPASESSDPMDDLVTDSRPLHAGFRLYKLEVFNWGTFDSTRGEVFTVRPTGQTTLLIGQNASGKSTLVDALLTLLVQPVVRSYNVAAGARKQERDERTYIKGAYGRFSRDEDNGTDVQFLRPDGSHYSVLLARFRNEQSDEAFTLAQVLYLNSEGGVEKVYCFAVASDRSRGTVRA